MQVRKPVVILAFTQVLSWGMLYYAFGVLAGRIQADLGLSASQVFGAFSWSVLVAGASAPLVGTCIDRYGGRWIMVAGSVVAAAGLWRLAVAGSFQGYVLGWSLAGIAMSLTLYEAAFATLNRSLASDAGKAISTVTLLGGQYRFLAADRSARGARGMEGNAGALCVHSVACLCASAFSA